MGSWIVRRLAGGSIAWVDRLRGRRLQNNYVPALELADLQANMRLSDPNFCRSHVSKHDRFPSRRLGSRIEAIDDAGTKTTSPLPTDLLLKHFDRAALLVFRAGNN